MKKWTFRLFQVLICSLLISCCLNGLNTEAAVKRPGVIKKVRAVSEKKGTIKLTCSKVRKGNYAVAYSTDKKQLKKVKNYTLKKVKNVRYLKKAKSTVTFKKLNTKKNYYIKACIYRKSGSKKIYGKWSRTVQVKANGSGKNNTQTPAPDNKPSGQGGMVSVNTADATIYAMDNWAKEYISIPAVFPQSYKIQVSGAKSVKYSVFSGDSVTVSNTGVVTPKITTWYWTGNIGSTAYNPNADRITTSIEAGESAVKVTADGKSYRMKVNVVDYVPYFANQDMEEYIQAEIKASMTDYEKLDAICKYAASFDYSASHSSAAGMIVSGGGDCWSSTSTIIEMCTKIGLRAYSRNANMDPGASSGHVNAVVCFGGKYYIAEAGYAQNAPRHYDIEEYDSPAIYTRRGSTAILSSYFGQEISEFTVADQIDGVPVTEIGYRAFMNHNELQEIVLPPTITAIEESAFYGCENLVTLNIPASVSSIHERALTCCNKLSNLKLDSENTAYAYENGVIYNKKKSKTVTSVVIPGGVCSIPDTVTEVGPYTFYCSESLKKVTVPSTVEVIQEGAFGDCFYLKEVQLSEGLTTIGNYAFRSCSELREITLPSTVTDLSDTAFQYSGVKL